MRCQWKSSTSVTWDQSSRPDAGGPLQQASASAYFNGDATVFPEVLDPAQLLGDVRPGSQFYSNQADTEYFQQLSSANRSSIESKRQPIFATPNNGCQSLIQLAKLDSPKAVQPVGTMAGAGCIPFGQA